MTTLDNVLSLGLTWLITYVIHSSVLLGFAAISQQCGMLTSHRLSERVWRIALFAGLLSSLLFCGLTNFFNSSAPISLKTSPPVLAVPSAKILNSSDGNAKHSQANLRSLPTESISNSVSYSPSRTPASLHPATPNQMSTEFPTTAWQLPADLKLWISAGFMLWLLYAGFISAKTYLSVRYLHRLVAGLPLVQREDLQSLLQRLAPDADITLRVCHDRSWNSPFACPNGTICMPNWTLKDIDPEQTYAMLTHEVRHVLRADGQWRIAQQLMTSLFFFQFFNRYANRQLDLLAEIDCDYSAIQSCSVEHYSRSLLRCAEMLGTNNSPVFAMSMAKPSSLLHRIDLLFNEDAMHTLVTDKHPKQTKIRALTLSSLAIISLSGISYAMPAFEFANENLRPVVISKSIPVHIAQIESPAVLPRVEFIQPSSTPERPSATADLAIKPVTPEILIASSTLTTTQQSNKFEGAQSAYQNKDFKLALQLFSELAKSGHAEAQFSAGEMLWRGEGSQVNPEAAMTLLTQAANQGHLKAQKYAALFAERAQHQTELSFYTQQFDGGKLKWTEQTCERPAFSNMLPSAKEYRDFINQLNANLTCYNNYVASLKQSLANDDYLNADLRRLMRTDEIEQSKQLARNIYFEMGTQAMQHSQQMLAEFDRMTEIWQSEIKAQSGRHVALGDEMRRAHFARMERRQVDVETGSRITTTFTNLKEK